MIDMGISKEPSTFNVYETMYYRLTDAFGNTAAGILN